MIIDPGGDAKSIINFIKDNNLNVSAILNTHAHYDHVGAIKKLKDDITILDELSYENWIHVIYSSNQVITPECGCTHISSACNVPVIIIYDSNNLPEAIYKEYHPWKSKHKKLVFGEIKLNEKIINNLT